MRIRLVRAVVAIALVLIAGLVAQPAPSYAASGMRTTAGWFAGDNTFTSPLDSDWKIGDCTLIEAMNPWYTYVRLSPPDIRGSASLTWGGIAKTSHTNNADVWWTTFTFIDASGDAVVESDQLRSPDMRIIHQFYKWSTVVPIVIDPALYPTITMVRWSSAC